MIRSFALVLSVLSLAACGPTPEAELEQFRENFGPFEDCGSVRIGICDQQAELFALGTCLQTALEGCIPAEGSIVRTTIEGDLVPSNYFVVQRGESCELVAFTDTTEDAYGAGEMVREVCDSIEVDETDPECTQVEASECRPELVY